jgi:hypothetical protein
MAMASTNWARVARPKPMTVARVLRQAVSESLVRCSSAR